MFKNKQEKLSHINYKKNKYLLISICLLMYMPFYGQQNTSICKIASLPGIQFKSKSASLLPSVNAILESVAMQLTNNPACKVKVIGYGSNNKSAQQLSWDRVNNVIRYLVEKQGISQDRLIFSYGEDGPPNDVDLQATTEEGPESVPAPHPQYQH